MDTTSRLQGFPPVVRKDAHVLILGSMPSEASLHKGQYYGHPRNAFWKIIYALFDTPFEKDYATRCEFLRQHRIALWDVYASCEREGSLDQDIRNESYNPLAEWIRELPDLQIVLCNGTKSHTAYRRYAKEKGLTLPCLRLPSTSPAAARYTFEEKTDAWRELLTYIKD